MRKVIVATLFVFLLLIGAALVACSPKNELATGDYTIVDVVYVGGISSMTRDALIESKVTTEVIIKDDSLSIISADNTEEWTDIIYVKDELNDEFILSKYHKEDEQLMEFFEKYSERYRYSIYNGNRTQLNYYIYQMDDDMFISQFAGDDTLIFSIDKITCSTKTNNTDAINEEDVPWDLRPMIMMKTLLKYI
ncbi:MAG: hypothetical protein PHR78_01355 [Eubacteriales bacterium]|nr:hypothetical protein [Eubacteriales bacterium]MDD4540804.1 hypothetical protein [Eubacteriales bacterium]